MGTLVLIFEVIAKIAGAIPVVDGWLRLFWFWWAARCIALMKEEDRAAVLKMLADKDQREVEKLLGYSKAGKPSGVGDIVSELPNINP